MPEHSSDGFADSQSSFTLKSVQELVQLSPDAVGGCMGAGKVFAPRMLVSKHLHHSITGVTGGMWAWRNGVRAAVATVFWWGEEAKVISLLWRAKIQAEFVYGHIWSQVSELHFKALFTSYLRTTAWHADAFSLCLCTVDFSSMARIHQQEHGGCHVIRKLWPKPMTLLTSSAAGKDVSGPLGWMVTATASLNGSSRETALRCTDSSASLWKDEGCFQTQ